MNPSLLAAGRSQLLLIDLQERLVPAMAGGAEAVAGAGILLEAARRLDVPVAVSEQYPKGLGPLVPEVGDALGNAARFEKTHFSCLADLPLSEHLAAIRRTGRHQLVLAGVEAHVCVLQTALEASDRGYDVCVATDAVASRAERSRDVAFRRMEACGVMLVTVEMILFEWLQRAGTETFRSLSRLIR